jgi:DNA-binding MarR family transcriptional regulator
MNELQLALTGELAAADGSRLREDKLSKSLLSGLVVLACMPSDGDGVGNAELARTTGLSISTTHRYISTLVAVGLVERDPVSRKYKRVII